MVHTNQQHLEQVRQVVCVCDCDGFPGVCVCVCDAGHWTLSEGAGVSKQVP